MKCLISALIVYVATATIQCNDERCDQDPIAAKLQSWYKKWKAGFQVDYITVDKLRKSYDFIVIGAGVGGSVVAHRLAMDLSHPKVLLLEAGGPSNTSGLSSQMIPVQVQSNQLTEIDWQYKSVPSDGFCCGWHNNRQHAMPRGKVVGGSGALNYMMWVRGHKGDWDDLMNVDGWKWKDVLPYFKKVESLNAYPGIKNDELRGYDGPIMVNSANTLKSDQSIFEQSVIDACIAEGIPYLPTGQNNGDNVGVAYAEYNIDGQGQRNNAFLGYNKYLRRVHKSAYEEGLINLDILTKAHVTKILFGKSGQKDDDQLIATSLKFVDISDTKKKEHTVRLSKNGEIILSAGALSSPQILKLSGIGPKNELDQFGIKVIKDLPGVGENLSDHVMSPMRYHFDEKWQNQSLTTDKVVKNMEDFDLFKEYLFKGKGRLSTSNSNTNAFIRSDYHSDKSYSDLQLYFFSGFDGYTKYLNLKENVYVEHECGEKEYWSDPNNMQNILTFVGLQHPDSIGYVRLQSSDPFVYPLIQPNYLKEQVDVDRLIYGAKVMDKIMRQPTMKRLWDEKMDCKKYGDIDRDDKALEQYIRDSIWNIYHPIGTCKMGDIENDEMAVVDNKLKVKGVKNLRVADASTLPRQTSGNTQLPVFMIGERAADFILNQWNSNK